MKDSIWFFIGVIVAIAIVCMSTLSFVTMLPVHTVTKFAGYTCITDKGWGWGEAKVDCFLY